MAHDGRIRIGILGAGLIAGAHVDGYQLATDRAVVNAIADIDTGSARRLAARVGHAEVVSDYHELFAGDVVDAVDICLPHHLHADAIVAAARAGKHVLCEKPLCLTVDEAETVARAIADSGITLMCAHNQLFLPTVRRARELIHEGALGTVYQARTTDAFFHTFDPATIGWRGARATSGGGELIDTGYHPTYLLLHLLPGEPVEVSAMLSRHRLAFMEGEDSAQVLVRFADGAVGSIETSWAYEPAGSTEKFSVVGDAGSLWSDGRSLLHRPRAGEPREIVGPGPQGPHTIALEVVDFIACLLEGRRPLNTEVEGISVLKVILAAYASEDRKRTVALAEL